MTYFFKKQDANALRLHKIIIIIIIIIIILALPFSSINININTNNFILKFKKLEDLFVSREMTSAYN